MNVDLPTTMQEHQGPTFSRKGYIDNVLRPVGFDACRIYAEKMDNQLIFELLKLNWLKSN